MLKNYITTILRNIARQRIFSIINVLGLTLGLASSMLIILYIKSELSYDKFHPDHELIHRVVFNGKLEGESFHSVAVGLPVAEGMKNEIAAVTDVLRITRYSSFPIRFEDKTFTENNFFLADSNFFQFFKFKLITGNPAEVLKGKNKVVISETTAKKYFNYQGEGDTSPIGKLLIAGAAQEWTLEVTGIAADSPEHSHFQFDLLVSLETSNNFAPIWLNSSLGTYFKINQPESLPLVQRGLDSFITKYCERELQQFLNLSVKDLEKKGGFIGFSTQPLDDIHLHSNFDNELGANSDIRYVYLFSAVAGLILLLACINFMNLSTARSANRAKEIGIRKVSGALRNRLMQQFLLESFFYTSIAFLLALGLISLGMNLFNELSGKSLTIADMFTWDYLLFGLALLLLISLFAGSYPAFYLTSYKPVEVLRGKIRAGMKSSGIRNSLVVFQFTISIIMIISTLMINRQIHYLQTQNPGFNKANLLRVLHTMNLGPNAEPFKQALLSDPSILAVSYSNRLPPDVDWSTSFKTTSGDRTVLMNIYAVDTDHNELMDYTMVSGRFFDKDFPSDSSGIILNETAVRLLGFKQPVEGSKLISFYNSMDGRTLTVIGVVKDFNFQSLHNQVRPMVMVLGSTPNMELGVRIAPGDPTSRIEAIAKLWKAYAPQTPFEYSFVEDNFEMKYRTEQKVGQVISVFTVLAILIACLGLFGLSAFTAEQRSREIGIRKVLGATGRHLIGLLTWEFIRLVLLAFVIAIPATYFMMSRWLESFAYRIGFSPWIVLIAGLVAVFIAVTTIIVQSARIITGNPVNAIKRD